MSQMQQTSSFVQKTAPALAAGNERGAYAEAAGPLHNRLFAALPQSVRERLRPHLELVQLGAGKMLFDPGHPLQHAYLPTSAIVSLVQLTRDGTSTELAVVGNDGLVGVSLYMGGDACLSQAQVKCSGQAYRLSGARLKEEFKRDGQTLQLLLHYAQALIVQVAHAAVCNRHHSIEQQFCRWLLQALDRLPGQRIDITQELMASLLGVRRESVGEAAGRLQAMGIIEYRRGRITVLDRPRLERLSCECYGTIRSETARLLPVLPVRFAA